MQIYRVGGAVRDKLLGLPIKDQDWVVVGATPERMRELGFVPIGRDFPVFLHPQSKEEYALARTERKTGHGYAGFTFYTASTVTLTEDLLRRDLTINAMAEDESGQIIDPFHGQDDLHNRLLRHVSPAFQEDPLRILRVARFAARLAPLGFQIADQTLTLMRTMVANGEASHLVAERVWQETVQALQEPSPATYFQTLIRCQALAVVLPELCALLDEQTLERLQQAARDHAPALVRFGCLFARLSDSSVIRRLQARLRLPGEYADLAHLVSEFGESISATLQHLDGQALMAIFESTDALRRPQRFATVLDVLAHCCPVVRQEKQATVALLNGCLAIKADSLVARGVTGKALGSALRQERIRFLASEVIAKNGDPLR